MGTLFYGAARFPIAFDERVLMHLQIVMNAKLRRGESFALSWANSPDVGSGRSIVWIAPSTDLHYKFDGSRPASINRKWLEELAVLANTPQGLHVTEEGSLTVLEVPPLN